MDARLTDLLRQFELERLEVNLFRGMSRDVGSPQVFGGQVLGQALMAAYETVEPRREVHSLHAYFLRRGDFNAPIVYDVDRARDGHSFDARRVVAIQHGQQIFNMSASFQASEPGLDHQVPMPQVPPPEQLADSGRPPRELLEHEVWGDDRPDSDALRTHIHALRQVLDKPYAFPMLRTIPGIGYKLLSSDAPV